VSRESVAERYDWPCATLLALHSNSRHHHAVMAIRTRSPPLLFEFDATVSPWREGISLLRWIGPSGMRTSIPKEQGTTLEDGMTNVQVADAIGPKRAGKSLRGTSHAQTIVAWIKFRTYLQLSTHNVVKSRVLVGVSGLPLGFGPKLSSHIFLHTLQYSGGPICLWCIQSTAYQTHMHSLNSRTADAVSFRQS
jgi:hypothetical protein